MCWPTSVQRAGARPSGNSPLKKRPQCSTKVSQQSGQAYRSNSWLVAIRSTWVARGDPRCGASRLHLLAQSLRELVPESSKQHIV